MEPQRLEREIEKQFAAIESNGWFPPDIHDPRHPHVALVHRVLQPRPGLHILDAGCARGRYLKSMANAGARVTGVDLTALFLRDAHTNLPTAGLAQATLRNLPFRDGAFDAALCNGVLGHLSDVPAAIAELSRVLRPGGTLLVINHNLSGLHPRFLLPAAWVKKRDEAMGRWMYPADFPFRERYFRPAELAGQLRTGFSSVEVEFIAEGHGRATHFYRIFPSLSCEAAWIARR